jgi:hypothetical protein
VTQSDCDLTQLIVNAGTSKSPLLPQITDRMVTSPNGGKIVIQLDSLYIFDGKSYHLDTIFAFSRPPKSQLPRFTPDGFYLIASHWNREVHIWDTRNWQRLEILYDDFYQFNYKPYLTPNGKYKIIKYMDWFGIQAVETQIPNLNPSKPIAPEIKPKKKRFF